MKVKHLIQNATSGNYDGVYMGKIGTDNYSLYRIENYPLHDLIDMCLTAQSKGLTIQFVNLSA